MKTATAEPLQVSRVRKLVGEWQSGPEDLLGHAQTKLRLSFALVPAQLPTNNSHEHAIHSGNGNGHLPLWWTRR
jgi:hypothetical protein